MSAVCAGSCVCGLVCVCGAHCVSAGRFSSILLFTTHIGTKQPAAVAVWIFGVLDDKSSLCGLKLELCGTLPAASLRVFAVLCASGSVCCKMEAGWRRRRMLPWPPSSSSSSHYLLYTSHGDHTPRKQHKSSEMISLLIILELCAGCAGLRVFPVLPVRLNQRIHHKVNMNPQHARIIHHYTIINDVY